MCLKQAVLEARSLLSVQTWGHDAERSQYVASSYRHDVSFTGGGGEGRRRRWAEKGSLTLGGNLITQDAF